MFIITNESIVNCLIYFYLFINCRRYLNSLNSLILTEEFKE